MKNKEKYAKEIVDAVTSGGYGFGFNKHSEEIKRCNKVKREWAESECVEKPVISKIDRSFLDYLRDRWKYMARDNISNTVYAFTEIPEKSKFGHFAYTGEARRISSDFNVVFPMVKWSNDSPWLIEDLKKLEVVDSYE